MRLSVVRFRALWLTGIALLLAAGPSHAQIADFQIVWIVVGDVVTSAGDRPVQAGKHLFMASDLAELSLKQVTVSRIDVDPIVTTLQIGDRFCVSSLRIEAVAPDGSAVKGAPLSVSVRQDHRDSLQLERTDHDICMRPNEAGEYSIRFASMLPASDGSTRGAQIFLRVAAPVTDESLPPEAPPVPLDRP